MVVVSSKIKVKYLFKLQFLWIQTNKVTEFRSYLKSVSDLDKLFRKITIKYIQPYELYNIIIALI